MDQKSDINKDHMKTILDELEYEYNNNSKNYDYSVYLLNFKPYIELHINNSKLIKKLERYFSIKESNQNKLKFYNTEKSINLNDSNTNEIDLLKEVISYL